MTEENKNLKSANTDSPVNPTTPTKPVKRLKRKMNTNRPVYLYDFNGNLVGRFRGPTDAAKQLLGYGKVTKTGKAGMTLQMHDCLNDTAQMNSSNTNSGGWESCVMRESNMATYFSQLTSAWQNAIKQVNKLSSAGRQSATIKTTADKLFLLAEVEIFSSTTYSKSGEGSRYAYYKAGNTKVKKVNGVALAWWERSPYGNNNTDFCNANGSGYANRSDASSSYGVSFAFCI